MIWDSYSSDPQYKLLVGTVIRLLKVCRPMTSHFSGMPIATLDQNFGVVSMRDIADQYRSVLQEQG